MFFTPWARSDFANCYHKMFRTSMSKLGTISPYLPQLSLAVTRQLREKMLKLKKMQATM